MRQAGRYMAEYRAVRERFGFLELCHNPQAAAEVTVTAVERLGVDAAIIFADILLILEPLDVGLQFSPGDGPALQRPVQTPDDVARLVTYDTDDALAFVYDAVRHARQGLGGRVPLIGFSGAPFTLASYLIEGGGARQYTRTKSFMYEHPSAWNDLLGLLARLINRYLRGQIAAGADAVQLFDSWVGCLSPDDYRTHVVPHTRAALHGLSELAPVIHFGTDTSGLLASMRDAGARSATAPSRATSTPSRCSPRPPRSAARPPPFSPALRAAPDTSSISATASCRRRRSTTCARWSTRYTR